ncbi:MAG TPA: AMP-binding protein, partial [Kribbellaceae bacterium]
MALLRGVAAPRARTLVDVLRATAASYGPEPALDDGSQTLSYDELLRAVSALAGRLSEAGIGPGDKVGIRLSSGTNDLYVA